MALLVGEDDAAIGRIGLDPEPRVDGDGRPENPEGQGRGPQIGDDHWGTGTPSQGIARRIAVPL